MMINMSCMVWLFTSYVDQVLGWEQTPCWWQHSCRSPSLSPSHCACGTLDSTTVTWGGGEEMEKYRVCSCMYSVHDGMIWMHYYYTLTHVQKHIHAYYNQGLLIACVSEFEITCGRWPFSVHFIRLADHKYTCSVVAADQSKVQVLKSRCYYFLLLSCLCWID